MYPKKVEETPAMRFRRCHHGALGALAKGGGPMRFFFPSGVGVGWKWGWGRWHELVEGNEISPEFHVQHQKATGTG